PPGAGGSHPREALRRTVWSSPSGPRDAWLFALVARLALLHEGGDAFFGILALEQFDEQLALKLQPFVELHSQALHRRPLDSADRERRTCRVDVRALESLVDQLGRRNHLVHDARRERVARWHRRAAEHEVECFLATDEPRKPLRAAGAGQ